MPKAGLIGSPQDWRLLSEAAGEFTSFDLRPHLKDPVRSQTMFGECMTHFSPPRPTVFSSAPAASTCLSGVSGSPSSRSDDLQLRIERSQLVLIDAYDGELICEYPVDAGGGGGESASRLSLSLSARIRHGRAGVFAGFAALGPETVWSELTGIKRGFRHEVCGERHGQRRRLCLGRYECHCLKAPPAALPIQSLKESRSVRRDWSTSWRVIQPCRGSQVSGMGTPDEFTPD